MSDDPTVLVPKWIEDEANRPDGNPVAVAMRGFIANPIPGFPVDMEAVRKAFNACEEPVPPQSPERTKP
jgi:hypothetical protein